jgi:hypothetical protein
MGALLQTLLKALHPHQEDSETEWEVDNNTVTCTFCSMVNVDQPMEKWVDSRARETGGTHSDFEVALRESLHLDGSHVRIDNCSFVDSFLTTDNGSYIYFADGAGMSWVQIPEGAYNGQSLAAAIEAVTSRTTIYDALQNTITHNLASATQPWLDDSALALFSAGFPADASREDPRSLNGVLGEGSNSSTQIKWSFVRMAPYTTLYLHSHKLRCEDTHDPRGTHHILMSIPLTMGIGSQVNASHPDGMFLPLAGNQSLRSFDLQLTDWLGKPVNLRQRPLCLQLSFV